MTLYQRPTLIGNIKRILSVPCMNTPSMWIELSADAFVRMAVSVVSPDPKEIYHHITGEPLVHSIRQGLGDIGDATGTPESPVRRFLGQAAGVTDQAVWFYFLIQAAADALIDSSSQAIAQSACTGARGLGQGTTYLTGFPDDGSWHNANYQFVEGSPYYPVASSALRLYSGNNWNATIACYSKFENDDGIPVGMAGRLIFYPDAGGTPTIFDSFSNAQSDGLASYAGNHIFGNVRAPGKQDGILSCEYSYSGTPQPNHLILLANGSTCFYSG